MTSRLDRLIAIDRQIRRGEFPGVRDLCNIFEVAPRTIFQDIKELRENLGLDIRFDKIRNGYFNAVPGKKLPNFALTEEEALLLVVAEEMLWRYAGPSFQGALHSAIHKICDNPSARLGLKPDKVEKLVHFLSDSTCQISCKLFLNLYFACSSRQLVEIVHGNRSLCEPCICQVEPYSIVHSKDSWHILSFNRTNDLFCRVPLAEIEQWRVLDEHFEQRELIALDDWIRFLH